MTEKRLVKTFTFQHRDWEGARRDLLPYNNPDGTSNLCYSGEPLPEGADVQIPHMATELFNLIEQGQNFDVSVYLTSENPRRYLIDITRVWR